MAKTKLELILEMKDRLSSSLKKAKDAVSTSTEEMKQKMRSLKTTFVGALADMRQELPLLDKALKLIHNPIVMLTTAIGAVAAGVRRLHQFANECVETYKVQAEAEEIAQEREQLMTNSIIENFDNPLGPYLFEMLTSVYRYPILTPQIEYIMSKASKKFKNDPYVNDYYTTAQENEKRMQGIDVDGTDTATAPQPNDTTVHNDTTASAPILRVPQE